MNCTNKASNITHKCLLAHAYKASAEVVWMKNESMSMAEQFLRTQRSLSFVIVVGQAAIWLLEH